MRFDCKGADKKIGVEFFSRQFSHMRGTIWEWNVQKLDDGGSQILVTNDFHAVVSLLQEKLFTPRLRLRLQVNKQASVCK